MADVIVMTRVKLGDLRLEGKSWCHLYEIKDNEYFYYASEVTFNDHVYNVLNHPDQNVRLNRSWRFIDGREYA